MVCHRVFRGTLVGKAYVSATRWNRVATVSGPILRSTRIALAFFAHESSLLQRFQGQYCGARLAVLTFPLAPSS